MFCSKNFLLLDEIAERSNDQKRPEPEECGVEFDRIRVKWPTADENDDQTLKDISFRVKPGQVLAVVGHVGSGKVSHHYFPRIVIGIQKTRSLMISLFYDILIRALSFTPSWESYHFSKELKVFEVGLHMLRKRLGSFLEQSARTSSADWNTISKGTNEW